MPEPEPPLKIVPSSTYQLRIELMWSSTARMKQALHCCGVSGTPTLNHTGELNAAFWLTSRWASSSAKTRASSAGGEVAVLRAPAGDRVDHPADQLADRGLTLRGAEGAAEVLLGNDVGGVLGPRDRELDVALLEGVAALLVVRDDRVADLPFDLVERVHPFAGEVAAEGQPLTDDLDVPLACDQWNPSLLVPLPRRWKTCGTDVDSYRHVIRQLAHDGPGTPRRQGVVAKIPVDHYM